MDSNGCSMMVFWQGLALSLGDAIDQSDTHITSNDVEDMEDNAWLCHRHCFGAISFAGNNGIPLPSAHLETLPLCMRRGGKPVSNLCPQGALP